MSAGSAAFAHIEDRLADTLLYEKGLDEVLQEQTKRIIKETRELRKRCERLEQKLRQVRDWLDSPGMGSYNYMEGGQFYTDKTAFSAEIRLALRAGDGQ